MPTCVALVPARGGSKRVPGKNIRPLGGHPLIAYTISAALDSGVFGDVIVSTDSEEIAAIARHYGASIPFIRDPAYAGDLSPDIEWIDFTLSKLAVAERKYDAFGLLRPTSPFRTAATIRRAWERFQKAGADSIRAVEPCSQHPGKMWVVEGERMTPVLSGGPVDLPWHSTPYQRLPKVYAQNASLEIAWCRIVTETKSIAGRTVAPFFTEGEEGFDINGRHDWIVAEHLVSSKEATLPPVKKPAYGGAA